MLRNKSPFTANITGTTGATGSNILFYNESTQAILYSVNTVKFANPYYFQERLTSLTGSGTLVDNIYITSTALPPGTYLTTATFVYQFSGSGNMNPFITANGFKNALIGDYNYTILSTVTVPSTRSPGAISCIFSNASEVTFRLVFIKGAGTSCTMLSGGLACVYLSPPTSIL